MRGGFQQDNDDSIWTLLYWVHINIYEYNSTNVTSQNYMQLKIFVKSFSARQGFLDSHLITNMSMQSRVQCT